MTSHEPENVVQDVNRPRGRVTEVWGAHVTFDLDGNEIAITTYHATEDATPPTPKETR